MARGMKDSGVEWVGKIPSEWSVIRCKYISKTFNGYAFNSNDFTREYKYSVLRIGDIFNGYITLPSELGVNFNKGLGTSRIKKNDILLAMSGATVGKVGLFFNETESYANQRVGIIRSQYQIYLYYVLSTKSFLDYIFLKANGSAQPNVSLNNFGNFYVPLPFDRDVKIIANYLDRKCSVIDSLTSDIEKQISLLEDYKKSLITETVTKGLNPNVEMKDSGIEWIGDVPKHWKISKLKYLIQVNNTKSSNNEYKYIGLENVIGWVGKLVDDANMSESEFVPESSSNKAKKGDVLFGKLRPYLGKVFISEENIICSTEFLIMRPVDIEGKYLKLLFLSTDLVNVIDRSTYGTKMPRANSSFILNQYIPIPNTQEQKEISDFLDKRCSEIDSLISDKKEQLEKLASYKQSMIYEYVTGKKEVPTQENA